MKETKFPTIPAHCPLSTLRNNHRPKEISAMTKLLAFDLDGTLTQHKTPIDEVNAEVLKRLSERYTLLMIGAGVCDRIFKQLREFPIDIIGNYGMQYAKYNSETKSLDLVRNDGRVCENRDEIEEKAWYIRKKYGFCDFVGDNMEYHPSGCLTLPLLGTRAIQQDKLAFDPDRKKRRAFYGEVCELFSDYNVFVGGSSSFDMAPKPFDKYYALDLYLREKGLSHSEAAFVGDDYGLGGNDESVYKSDIKFVTIDDYRTFPKIMEGYLG